MRVKGRRQSENVVYLPDPVSVAKREVQFLNDPEMIGPARRIETEVLSRDVGMEIQGEIRDPVREHFRQAARGDVNLKFDEIVNESAARNVQNEFRREKQGMEILMGQRWRD